MFGYGRVTVVEMWVILVLRLLFLEQFSCVVFYISAMYINDLQLCSTSSGIAAVRSLKFA